MSESFNMVYEDRLDLTLTKSSAAFVVVVGLAFGGLFGCLFVCFGWCDFPMRLWFLLSLLLPHRAGLCLEGCSLPLPHL